MSHAVFTRNMGMTRHNYCSLDISLPLAENKAKQRKAIANCSSAAKEDTDAVVGKTGSRARRIFRVKTSFYYTVTIADEEVPASDMDFPMRCFLKYFRRFFLSYACLAVSCGLLLGLVLVQMTNGLFKTSGFSMKFRTTTLETPAYIGPMKMKGLTSRKGNKTDMKLKWLNEKIERLNQEIKNMQMHREVSARRIGPSSKFHIFYYAWYENVEYDGAWKHWNHEYLKNWMKSDRKIYPAGRHAPPDDIGSNFYPALGCYSSRNPKLIDIHMRQIRDAGIGVVIVSWYPPGLSDGSGRPPDLIFSDLLNAAARYKLKIAAHIEPYKDRSPNNLKIYLKYFMGAYGNHPGLYKAKKNGKELVVHYIYDSYRIPASSWRELLSPRGNITVRGTPEDGIFLGLLVDINHRHEIKRGYFDGFYTYFASNGFSYGSTWKNWKSLSIYARRNDLLFSPSIGPGYIDTRIRPWNSGNTRHRRRGKYYDVGWRTAISAGADFFSITSFNEWHEGTQIEPAVSKSTKNYTYMDYEPEGSSFYLNLTNWWINEISNGSKKS